LHAELSLLLLRVRAAVRTGVFRSAQRSSSLHCHARHIPPLHCYSIRSLDRKFVPEIKKPDTPLPLDGPFTQKMYVQKVIDEYKQANIPPKDVWVQSFEYPDIKQIIDTEREFAKQAVLLDDEVRTEIKKKFVFHSLLACVVLSV
jgi:glycerophosphoryl diester phosphodiesterase